VVEADDSISAGSGYRLDPSFIDERHQDLSRLCAARVRTRCLG
jgi:hypothetical protein